MKLSFIFELLLIFVLLAFAASKSIKNPGSSKKGIQNRNDVEQPEDNSFNKYCKCSEAFCNCCRDFSVPLVSLDGPGCASLMYLNGDKMAVSLSFGRKVITNKTLSSRKPTPICMPLPGKISKFCGRVYNIARSGEEFRACLGLELQNRNTVEAAVRVSCFKFGPRGVHMEAADPLPLVAQDEKESTDDDDDDDDDDEEDDFGLGVDDDDADLDAINDVESADYTGFSLLGEDLLGDLFGSSSSGKKSNKNKNKKKQAPSVSTTSTTTTRRPRPSRRPTRRPSTRTTTPRSTRSTTVRVRPVNRRPTRKPGRRPSRRPQTTTTEVTTPSSASTAAFSPSSPSLPTSPEIMTIITSPQTTERSQFSSSANDYSYEPVVIVTQKPLSTLSVSSPKPVTNFGDPGIEMSLAQLTGQLSAMPVTPIIPNSPKDSGMMTSETVSYEKVETITPKGTTVAFSTDSDEKVRDELVQVVESLDSTSEENATDKEIMVVEESRAHYEGLQVPRGNKEDFSVDDLDVLDLSAIGESVGAQLGLFGRNKRQNKNKNPNKKPNESDDDDSNEDESDDDEGGDYDVLGLTDIGETVSDQLGILARNQRQNRNKNLNGEQKHEHKEDLLESLSESFMFKRNGKGNKRSRSRQNKMMKGDWSLV